AKAGVGVNVIICSPMDTCRQGSGLRTKPALLAHLCGLEKIGIRFYTGVCAGERRTKVASQSVKGVSTPEMPHSAPGTGPLDGKLVNVDFDGTPFSRDQAAHLGYMS